MDDIFQLSFLLVGPLWALMILLPRWRWTERLLRSPWCAAPAALLYGALVLPVLGQVWPVVSDPSLPRVAALLGSDGGATIGWVHFLAFDLFVGRWAYLDARERGISAWVMAPVLFLTLMLGPLGLLAYLVVREVARRRPLEARAGGTAAAPPRGGASGAVLAEARAALRVNRPLALLTVAMVPAIALTLAGVALDPRQITGAPAWLKPAKFAISIGIYCATLLWMLGRVEGHRRWVAAIGWVTALALGGELLLIAVQAWRGVASHFNVGTPLDGAIFAAMGQMVLLIWLMNLVAAVLLLRQRMADRALAWSIRLGLIAALLGGVAATPMLAPTAEQRAGFDSGGVATIGAHAVGVPDGGGGLPVTGWSTTGGDLRVAHFVGLHGLQAIPLWGLLLAWRRRREEERVGLVMVGGGAYLGLIGLLCWQALRGEPLLAPSAATLAAVAGLAAVTLVAATVVRLSAGAARPMQATAG